MNKIKAPQTYLEDKINLGNYIYKTYDNELLALVCKEFLQNIFKTQKDIIWQISKGEKKMVNNNIKRCPFFFFFKMLFLSIIIIKVIKMEVDTVLINWGND